MENSIAYTINCKGTMPEKLYILETLFVSGIYCKYPERSW
jgi:hypothetical protein